MRLNNLKAIKKTLSDVFLAKGPATPSHDMGEEFKELLHKAIPYSLTSQERMYAMHQATEYVSKYNIPGDIVECGVWKGGSAMISALKLMQMQDTERKIYLYDTYEGMSEPTEKDVNYCGRPAQEKWELMKDPQRNNWCYASVEEVRKNVFSTGYPENNFIFVKGKVEDTIPAKKPSSISILRLDTDWYESTYHELVHLFPLLSPGGVIIIDDYGHWSGAREATDKYFRENNIRIFLGRIDNTGRIGIKN